MAKIAGEIEAADNGVSLAENNRWLSFDMRLPVQPPEWTTESGYPRHRVNTFRQITIGAFTTIERWLGWDGTSGDGGITGPKAAEWVVYGGINQHPAWPTGTELGLSSMTYTEVEPRRATSPAGWEVFLEYYQAANEGEIQAVCFEMENDEVFTASEPSSTLDYETIGRNTGTWSPYAKNRSCSAWLMQRIIAQNFNKILYQTKQVWTVPL